MLRELLERITEREQLGLGPGRPDAAQAGRRGLRACRALALPGGSSMLLLQ